MYDIDLTFTVEMLTCTLADDVTITAVGYTVLKVVVVVVVTLHVVRFTQHVQLQWQKHTD